MTDLNDSKAKCERLRELLTCETSIIKKHIDEHKWFQKIGDYDTGVHDFVSRYGWLMRELFCGYACKERDKCELAKTFLPENQPPKESQS